VGVTKRLPEKRRRFVEAYLGEACGNATEAARIAGYQKPGQEGHRLLKTADVSAAIGNMREKTPPVMDVAELRRWWASLVKDEDEITKDRLKASELLGKSLGAFLDPRELQGPDGVPLRVHVVEVTSEEVVTIEQRQARRLRGGR
jgi:phage terminase small subunit